MALKQMNQTETATQFEDEGAVETAVQETVQNIVQETAQEVVQEVAQTAVAKTGTSALAVKTEGRLTAKQVIEQSALTQFKDAFPIDWDSVPAITAASAQFKFKEDGHKLGSEISIDLLSYQDSYVCSPNSKKADVKLVKFSDDGITANDGTDLKQHLAMLKQDWEDARIDQRVILVGELVAETGEKASERLGQLVQISLPSTGVRAWKGHILQLAMQVGKKRMTFDESKVIKLKATDTSNKKGDEYTAVTFKI